MDENVTSPVNPSPVETDPVSPPSAPTEPSSFDSVSPPSSAPPPPPPPSSPPSMPEEQGLPIGSPPEPIVSVPVVPPKSKSPLKSILLGFLFVIILSAAAYYYFLIYKKPAVTLPQVSGTCSSVVAYLMTPEGNQGQVLSSSDWSEIGLGDRVRFVIKGSKEIDDAVLVISKDGQEVLNQHGTFIVDDPDALLQRGVDYTLIEPGSYSIKGSVHIKGSSQDNVTSPSCNLSFTLAEGSTALSPAPATDSSKLAQGKSITPTPKISRCNQTCATSLYQCAPGLTCTDKAGTAVCRNVDCPDSVSCICSKVTPTTTTKGGLGTEPTPTEVSLPEAGLRVPTLMGILAGFLLISLGAALVF